MLIRLFKKAEKTTNKIRIPKEFIEKNGNEFYMDVDYDKNIIILVPIKK